MSPCRGVPWLAALQVPPLSPPNETQAQPRLMKRRPARRGRVAVDSISPSRDALPHTGERICSRDRRAIGGRRLELYEQFIVDHSHVSHIRFAYVLRRN
jgi:hypothetical protein